MAEDRSSIFRSLLPSAINLLVSELQRGQKKIFVSGVMTNESELELDQILQRVIEESGKWIRSC